MKNEAGSQVFCRSIHHLIRPDSREGKTKRRQNYVPGNGRKPSYHIRTVSEHQPHITS
jgi:hypothetical protein